MTIRTKRKFVCDDGTETEDVISHRFGKIIIKEDIAVQLDDNDLDSDTVSVPKGTTGYVVEFVDEDSVRINFDVELGNGIIFGFRNKLALKIYIDLEESLGTEFMYKEVKEQK